MVFGNGQAARSYVKPISNMADVAAAATTTTTIIIIIIVATFYFYCLFTVYCLSLSYTSYDTPSTITIQTVTVRLMKLHQFSPSLH